MANWHEDQRGAVRMGSHHGRYCLGCFWLLMVLLFVLGVIAVLGFCLMALLPLVFSMATPWFLGWIFLVWLVAMGVVLLRLKEPVAPDSAA